jgi:hypothetical protein
VATLGASALAGSAGLSFGGTWVAGASPGTGFLVGGGFGAMSLGVGLLVVGGLIDSHIMSGLFGPGKSKWTPPRLLGLPANSQLAGDPRFWAIGRRVRVPTHTIWQSEKRFTTRASSGLKSTPNAQQRQVILDCAVALNDRQTNQATQIIGQGKLLTYETRNIVSIRTSNITVGTSSGRLTLSMQNISDPDFADKFEVDDIVTLDGFVPDAGTPDINRSYWKVYAVTTHTSTPSVMTLSIYAGQSLSGLSSTSGVEAAPASVTRVDDALVKHDWGTGLQAGFAAPNYPGPHDPSYGIPPRLVLTGPSHPEITQAFQNGDIVRVIGATVTVLSGHPAIDLSLFPCTIRAIGTEYCEVYCPNLDWWATGVTWGSSTNAAVIRYDQAPKFSPGLFPSTFVPADNYHSGTSSQTADALIVSEQGVGNVPGYRGIAYQVLEGFNVTVFGGNVPPQLEAVIDPDDSITWRDAFRLVAVRCGIEEPYVDVSGVTPSPFEGMYLRGAVAGTTVMQPMLLARQVATQERDGVIAFFDIDNADAVQIRNGERYSDLIDTVAGADSKISYEDMVDADLPSSVGIKHQDPDTYYTEGYQFYGLRNPSASDAENRQEVDLSNLVLTRKQAANLAGTLMRRAYINSRQIRMQLPANYLHVQENDLLTVTDDDGNDLTVRVIRRDIGANFLVQITAVVEEVSLDVVGSPVQSEAGNVNRPPVRLAPVVGRVLDIAPLRDDDSFAPGLLLCAGPSGSGPWAGCSIYRTTNAGSDWTLVGTLSFQSTVGRTSSVLAGTSASEVLGSSTPVWDSVSTVDIELDSEGYTFPLVSNTEAAVLGGVNWFAIKHADGAYEIIGARDIVQNSATSYTLSYLLRGIRGTVGQCEGNTPIGAEITGISFLPNSDGLFLGMSGLSSSRTLEFRFVPPGYDVTDVESVSLTAEWRNCRPFPVRDITKTINGSNDVRFTVDNWTRTNISISQVGPYPMDETYETYRFDLYDPTGTGLRYSRTISASGTGTPTLRDKWVEFTSAEITLAGYTPGPSETFFIDVVQVGDYGDSPSVLQEL